MPANTSIEIVDHQQNGASPQTGPVKPKFAYVFYVTTSHYVCYAMANIARLIDDLHTDPRIDIVVLATVSSKIDRFNFGDHFPKNRVKIHRVHFNKSLTNNAYYAKSYVRFEAFGLYDQYDRLVVIDGDGVILKNLDHLFTEDMKNFDLAASFAYYLTKRWLSSVFLVVNPSRELYENFTQLLNRESLAIVAKYADGHHYDMDILNYYFFHLGGKVKILPKYYAILDSYFTETVHVDPRLEYENTYYLHFSAKKPLLRADVTRQWPLTDVRPKNGSFEDMFAKMDTGKKPFFIFWMKFDQYCRVLVQIFSMIEPHEN